MIDTDIEFRELPLSTIQEDEHQPRTSFNTDGEKNRLLVSLRTLGIQQPLAIAKTSEGKYTIIDGHRRYRCAKELGVQNIPCRIYSALRPGELERVRFEIQNNRRPWKPLERAEAILRIKAAAGYSSNKELADSLFISTTLVSNSLNLGKEKDDYKMLMDQYGLSESYRVEFVKLKPKLRPIKDFTINQIIQTLFERVSHSVIRSAKDFRTVGRIFLRATANSAHIYEFLSDPDMTVKALEQNTIQSGFSLCIEQVIQKLKGKEKTHFSSNEKVLLTELKKLLDHNFS